MPPCRLRHGALAFVCIATLAAADARAQQKKGDQENVDFEPEEDPQANDGTGEPEAESPDAESPDEGPPAAEADSEGTPPWTVTGIPPEGYAEFEVIDLEYGMRNDYFYSIEVDERGVAWLGTYEGRVYRSTDDGKTWEEYTVLPELKSIYGFVAQKVLLGHLRSDDARAAENKGLGGFSDPSFQLLGPDGVHAGIGQSSQSSAFGDSARFVLEGEGDFPFAQESRNTLFGGSSLLGAGLSARAPRLSLLLTILRRPIANISLQRLLFMTASRLTFVNRVVPHPTDPDQVFAATTFGLYHSLDQGVSWFRAFPGMTIRERIVFDVVADPTDPKRIYMGTSSGLFMSDDGGQSWRKNTSVPEIMVKKIAVDSTDGRYVYVAGYGGVYRSDNKAETFVFAFYHSLRRRRDVFWIEIDPFDPNTAYLGTGDGFVVTHNLRTSTSQDWSVVNGLRTVNLVITTVGTCTRHPGHIYIMTRADLPTINYGANGPESLLLETWDYGKSFRPLAGNRTAGDIRWFSPDPRDPDTVWVAFSRAVARVQRKPPGQTPRTPPSQRRLHLGEPVFPDEPTMTEMLQATLKYHGLDLQIQQARLDRLRHSRWVPTKVNLAFQAGRRDIGSTLDDIRFVDQRFRQVSTRDEWRIMGFLSWNLPEIIHRGLDSTPMMRFRELMLNDDVRNRMVQRVYRNYGELQRIKARARASPDRELRLRVLDRIRIEYLEAIVDLMSGGYLSDWKKKARK